MQSPSPADVERKLSEHMGDGLPENPASDVGAALQVADRLEAEGFAFVLRDMCPKSLDSLWRAVFSRDGVDCAVEHPQSALAVCAAAVAALRGRSDA